MITKSTSIKKYTIFMVFFAIMFFAMIATGCSHSKPVPVAQPSCPLPAGNFVDHAFDTARTTLSNPGCKYKFDQVMQALLGVCEGSPGMENKKLFSDFLVWAKDHGIISTVQAKEFYNQYFTSTFVSLSDDYQTCSLCLKINEILSDCDKELEKKKQGLIKICGDKITYTKASNDLKQISLILEATCKACDAE